jgi:CubicO group peptidase (beta-lactamase class C family)
MEMWVGEPADPLRYILEKPLHAAPGGKFDYRDADPQLIAFALHALTGRHEKQLVDEWLFGPLQIEDWYWDEGRGGVTMGAHGLHLRPRDLAKIGQLVLDRGVWRGQRIVSAAWIDASTFPQLATPEQGSQGPLSYGYYWWSAPQQQAFSAWGHGGQYALIAPERNLVIVQVAMPDAALHGARLGEFLELVAPLLGR